MNAQMWTVAVGVCVAGTMAIADEPPARPAPINALLITGHNNHNWQYTSRVHKETLEGSGRFKVDITDDPAATLADAAGLKKYQLFVLDYNDYHQAKRWGEQGAGGGAAEKNFANQFVHGAGWFALTAKTNQVIGSLGKHR